MLHLWLNDECHTLTLPSARPLLLRVLDAHGVAYQLRRRAWQNAALGDEPLLVAVGELEAPLEIVRNGRLAAVGVARLRVRAGDEVVIGQPEYLRRRFSFFR